MLVKGLAGYFVETNTSHKRDFCAQNGTHSAENEIFCIVLLYLNIICRSHATEKNLLSVIQVISYHSLVSKVPSRRGLNFYVCCKAAVWSLLHSHGCR